ncbi:MAG: amidohydrolase family protein [Streptosporangiales bacterium]|nr:amidohydrolase family protein [Streptosporangiales bacterium]
MGPEPREMSPEPVVTSRADRVAVTARWVLTGHRSGTPELVPHGTVVVRDGRIEDVTTAEVADARRIRLPGNSLLLPGFVDVHSHSLNGPLFRGMTEDRSRAGTQSTLVYDVLMPVGDLAATTMTDDEARAVYTASLLRILAGGTTTTVDVFRPRHRAFLDAARDVGIRAYGAPYLATRTVAGVDAHGTPVTRESDGPAQLEHAVQLFREYDEGPGGRIRVMLGPHCTDTCSPAYLAKVLATARDLGTNMTIHVAQSRPELAYLRRHHDCTPVEFLARHGICGPDVVAAHCAFATPDDLAVLASTGTPVACCPATFVHSGRHVSYRTFVDAGVTTGIGTDGHSLTYLEELRVAGTVAKLAAGGPSGVTSADLLRTGTEGSAAVLGRSDLGRIERGARADLVGLTLNDPGLEPVLDPLSTAVWHSAGTGVDLVVVDGAVLVEQGRHTRIDAAAVRRSANAVVERIWETFARASPPPT